ncbi:DNA-directed RNA polymerase, mitochondrial [Ctenodactylus gundi]
MSALRLGRGAVRLRGALRSSGCQYPAAEEGMPGGRWGPRRSSSANPCEQNSQKDWGHVELLEVLEARLRQLQAESVSEVTVRRVQVARLPADRPEVGGLAPKKPLKQPPGNGGWVRRQTAPKSQEKPGRMPAGQQEKPQSALQFLAPPQPTRPLRVEPELVSRKLASCLKGGAQGSPKTPWEEQLDHVLRQVPRKLSKEEQSAADDPQMLGKIQRQRQRLQAFFQGCLASGHVSLAHHVLVSHHGRPAGQGLTLAMYNDVMLGWARKGSLRELVYVFFMLKDAGFNPDLLSYACALQCMGRTDQKVSTILRCLKQMARDGLQLSKLFSDVVLSEEERAVLLRAVLKAKPTFCPPQRPPPPRSTSALLREVYAQDGSVSYPRLHLPLKTLQNLFHQQLAVELATSISVESVELAPKLTEETVQARKTLATLRKQWEAALLAQLQATKAHLACEAHKGHPTFYPYLCLVDEGDIVQVFMQALQSLPAQGEAFVHVVHQLALRLLHRHAVQHSGGQAGELERRYVQYLHLLASDTRVPEPCLPRQYWEALGQPQAAPTKPLPLPMVLQLGKLLVEILVKAVQIPHSLVSPQGSSKSIPVLYHVYSFRGFRQIGLLKPHPAFTQLQVAAAEPTLAFDAVDMPMLCPPLPWTSWHAGAYLLSSTKLIRSVEGFSLHQRLLERHPPAELHGALDALTQLGNCAWRVNGRVLDLVLEVFRNNGCPRLGVPPPASEAPSPQPSLPPHLPLTRKAELRHEMARCLKVAREMHSLRQEALYRLSLAQHLRHRVFWLPHNMDFRGRTYPCPPHFNHLGSDLARALLEFAQGRPLGPRGLDWLKIHLVNLTGLKKREPLRSRLAFADTIMDDILDSADNPMTGRRWWMEADEPWQTLACCMEVAKAVRSSDPAAYVSHLPVHQDGSCNGLQHYAALGRDAVGAASVNLVPSEEPQDVYSEVAAQVEVFRRQDAEQGLQVAQVLEGFVSRKVVKQTVMTVVYGVTRYGGRLQIEKRLRELSDFPQLFVWEASYYLVQQVFRSLQEMFSGTRTIQHWLTESARLISQAGSAVEWITPLGIPIIQPYFHEAKLVIRGGLQSVTWNNSEDLRQKPNTRKQKNGFPPNFIHSLDSCHMMLTALHCYRKGLTFVSVHDCFWTHACDVSIMNQVCREQFVRMHSQPILENLSAFLVQRFASHDRSHHPENSETDLSTGAKLLETLQAVPEKGDFNLEQVKDSTYFFS